MRASSSFTLLRNAATANSAWLLKDASVTGSSVLPYPEISLRILSSFRSKSMLRLELKLLAMAPLRPSGDDDFDLRERSKDSSGTEKNTQNGVDAPSEAHIEELIRVARTSLFLGTDSEESTDASTPL